MKKNLSSDDLIVDEPKTSNRVYKVIIATCVLLFVIVLGIVAITYLGSPNNGKPVSIFGYKVMIVKTGSMVPTIPIDSMIIVKEVDANSLQKQDIITFVDNIDSIGKSVLNTHRIVETVPTEVGTAFITRGDAAPENDEKNRYADQIIGKVVLISPIMGKIATFISSPIGIALLIFLPLILILLSEAIRFFKERKIEVEEDDGSASFGKNSIKTTGGGQSKMSGVKSVPLVALDDEIDSEKFNQVKSNLAKKIPVQNFSHTLYSKNPEMNTRPLTNVNIADLPDLTLPNFDDSDVKIRTRQDELDDFPSYKIVTKQEEDAEIRARMTELAEETAEEKVVDNMGAFAFIRQHGEKTFDDKANIKVLNRFSSGKNDLALMTNNENESFSAMVKKHGQDSFSIDGIDVMVNPNSISMNLEKASKTKEIAITVTKDYTNVVVDGKEYEVNFALFKDEEDNQKVVIQKKAND